MLSVLFIIIIYLFTTFFFSCLPVFSKASWTGSCIKLLSLVSKGFLLVYLYISSSFTLVLLLFGEANTWRFDEKQTWHVFFSTDPQGNLNKLINIVCETRFFFCALIKNTLNVPPPQTWKVCTAALRRDLVNGQVGFLWLKTDKKKFRDVFWTSACILTFWFNMSLLFK